jgi:hypothetical protein
MTESIIQEIWKPVFGYEVFYKVSNHGNVRVLDRKIKTVNLGGPYVQVRRGRVMKQLVDRYGYRYISLTCSAGLKKKTKVHHLVALAFHGKPTKEQTQINHKDSNKLNNDSANLEWCTIKENHQHAYKNGHHALNKHRCPKTGRMLSKGDYSNTG